MKTRLRWGAPGMKWGQPLKWGQGFIEVDSEVASIGASMESKLGSTEIPVPVVGAGSLATPTLKSASSNEEPPQLGKAG